MFRTLLAVAIVGFASAASPAMGQASQSVVDGVRVITDAADRLCQAAPTAGLSREIEVSGQLSALAQRLAQLGVQGTGRLATRQYEGVLQEHLAGTMGNTNQCKLTVFQSLFDVVFGPRRPVACLQPTSPDLLVFSRRLAGQDTWLFQAALVVPPGLQFLPDRSAPFLERLAGHDAEVGFELRQPEIAEQRIVAWIFMRNSHRYPNEGRNARVALRATAFYDAELHRGGSPPC